MPSAEALHRTLTETAVSYLGLGWSVVPLWGDSRPEQAKVPAVAWAAYQRRRAVEPQVTHWFTATPYRGLGIVTGSISQLVVLDFDDVALAERFATQCPELTATRTVRTRRGQHLYFRAPAYLRLPTRKLAGVDLLSDGCYVVAPPTAIDGHTYTVEQGGLPRMLVPDDILALNAFLDRTAAESPKPSFRLTVAEPTVKTQEEAFSRQEKASAKAAQHPTEDSDSVVTAEALVAFYHVLVGTMHRNNALFKAACLARDRGWRHEAVVAVLGHVHAAAVPRSRHRQENPKSRQREAERTIRSAFSKPPRPVQPVDKEGLFNSVREKLLQLGQTCVVRVLEGLRLAGIKAGQLVTEQTIIQLLKGVVGQYSIRKTLAATTPDGTPLFERISPRYPPHCAAAKHIRTARQKTAYVNETEPQRIAGRQAVQFRIPTPAALCAALGVTPSGTDPVTVEDLQSAKKMRQAMQLGLIARRPGTYLRKWLADRLGVSERTLSRYNTQTAGLNSVPTFTQTPLGWGNLNAIPSPDVAPVGTCLEDSTGKRWPALKGIAQKLLAQGRGVRLLMRGMNYYWVGNGDPPALNLAIERRIDIEPVPAMDEPLVSFGQRISRLMRTMTCKPDPEPAKASPPEIEPVQAAPYGVRPLRAGDAKPIKHRRQFYYKALKDPAAEALANQVYASVNARTCPQDRMSLATARRWVTHYQASKVRQALDMLATRNAVERPVGLMATILRTL